MAKQSRTVFRVLIAVVIAGLAGFGLISEDAPFMPGTVPTGKGNRR